MTASPFDITKDTKLVVNPNLVLREEDGEGAILFDPDSGAVRILNLTATSIYKLLDGRRTLSEVIEALKEEFVDMDANAEEEVYKLIQDFYQIGVFGTLAEVQR